MGKILRPKTEHRKSEQFDNQTIMVCLKSERVRILDVDSTVCILKYQFKLLMLHGEYVRFNINLAKTNMYNTKTKW